MAKFADITPFYEWLEDLMRLDTSNYPDHNTLMFYEIFDELDSLPELVRCKDCKHYEIHKPSVLENCERKGYLIPMNPDDFCSYGEREK